MQEFYGFCCIFWPHYEMFADGQKGEVDRDIVSDQFQIGEQGSIPGMKHYFPAGLNDNPSRLAEIDRISILSHHRRAMDCLCELNCTKGIPAPTSEVLGRNLLPLMLHPYGQFICRNNDASRSFFD